MEQLKCFVFERGTFPLEWQMSRPKQERPLRLLSVETKLPHAEPGSCWTGPSEKKLSHISSDFDSLLSFYCFCPWFLFLIILNNLKTAFPYKSLFLYCVHIIWIVNCLQLFHIFILLALRSLLLLLIYPFAHIITYIPTWMREQPCSWSNPPWADWGSVFCPQTLQHTSWGAGNHAKCKCSKDLHGLGTKIDFRLGMRRWCKFCVE